MNFRLITLSVMMAVLFLACEAPKEEENNTAETNSTNLSVEKKELIVPVEVINVKNKKVTETFELTGTLLPYRQVEIYSEAQGKVVNVYKEIGSVVNTGDTLAKIDDVVSYNNLLQAKAGLLSAENGVAIAELNLSSDKTLHDAGDISDLAYEDTKLKLKTAKTELLSAKATLSQAEKAYYDTRVVSPINGVVSRKYIEFGSMVNFNSPVYRVVQMNRLKIELGVPQSIISRVQSKNYAMVYVNALNKTIEAKIERISPQADESTGAFTVELVINNNDNKFKPGMTCKVELYYMLEDAAIVVPDYSIIEENGDVSLYVIKNNKAVLTKVKKGFTFGNSVVIDNGLKDGDRVVIVGMDNLGVNTKVNIEATHDNF